MYNYNLNNGLYHNSFRNMNSNMPKLFTPNEGYDAGNMFSDLYDQYKNYKSTKLSANNERERLLLELSRLSFAAHELNLYLDVYPNDNTMLTLFNDYLDRVRKLEEEYNNKFGQLDVIDNMNGQSPFKWVENMWPWEAKFNV